MHRDYQKDIYITTQSTRSVEKKYFKMHSSLTENESFYFWSKMKVVSLSFQPKANENQKLKQQKYQSRNLSP